MCYYIMEHNAADDSLQLLEASALRLFLEAPCFQAPLPSPRGASWALIAAAASARVCDLPVQNPPVLMLASTLTNQGLQCRMAQPTVGM